MRLTAGLMAACLSVATSCVAYYEGYFPNTYSDPVGIKTICYGHTGPDVTPGRVASIDECMALLSDDLKQAYMAVSQCVRVPIEIYEGAAMVSLAFNVGGNKFCGSTMVKLVNAGADSAVFCQQFTRWNKARVLGFLIELPGLTKRRESERQICLGHSEYVHFASAIVTLAYVTTFAVVGVIDFDEWIAAANAALGFGGGQLAVEEGA